MKLLAADLFCGAGGTTTGLLQAAARLGHTVDMLAVNHWNLAIDTHTLNHPGVRHLCESLATVNPRQIVPGGKLHILCASPECTHHSRARGGKPCNDQSRAGAFHVLDWLAALRVDNVLLENVPEFTEWGPLTRKGKPHKRQKGRIYQSFLASLESLGYRVTTSILNCADYGDPTTRRRLFILAQRGRTPKIPSPSHSSHSSHPGSRWRAAREIIDWSFKGSSIFTRSRPLADNTLRRIVAGLNKYSGLPFLVTMEHGGGIQSVDKPLPTITCAKGGAIGLANPFLVELRGTSQSHIQASAHSLEFPVPTLTAGGSHVALCEPMLIGQQSCAAARPVSEPVPTVASAGAIALIEPYLVKYYGSALAQPVTEPLDTVTARDRFGLVQPTIEHHGQQYRLDIHFRMLAPHELAAAQGFPIGYQFAGTREARVKQIGNAVPVNTAAALCHSLLSN